MMYLDLTRDDLFHTDEFDAYFACLRRERPVHRDDIVGKWMVTGYDEVAEAYTNDLLSSARGTVLGGSVNSVVDSASNNMLICSDDPFHKRLRKLCAPAFLRDAIDEAMHTTTDYLTQALAAMPRNEPADYLTSILRVLPIAFLQSCFPMSYEDARQIVDLTQKFIGHADQAAGLGQHSTSADTRGVAHLRLLLAIRERYRRAVENDQLTAIQRVAGGHDGLNEEQIIYNLLNIVVGGNETTPFTAAAITYELLTGDTERYVSSYLANPGAFVDEVIRWTTTNAYVQRYALEDTTVGGCSIKQGESAIMWNYSANRDEKYFPAEFTPERAHPVSHIAFGRGKHRCIGANVATSELITYLNFLIPNLDRIRPMQAPTVLRSNFMRGFTAMPVEIS